MKLDASIEAKLYAKETISLPSIVKDKFPKIQSVYQPENIRDLKQMISESKKSRIPVIPRGAATSGMGGITPLKRSIMADLTHINRILDLDEKKKMVSFEAGLRWWELKHFLKKDSLDLYTCPTSLFSTVGGWLSTGGYGINSFRYGHISNLVESIEVITPNKTMTIDRREPEFKYFIGTEGQMGIITKVGLKIRDSKSSKSYLVFFKNTSTAVDFVYDILKSSKIPPTHISYFDPNRLEHKNLHLKEKISFPQMEGVFTVFEEASSEREFLNLIERKKGMLAEDYLTEFLWNERFFPFSMKHFHHSILGCEIILPIKYLDHYVAETREFGKNYGIPLSTEATFINKHDAVVFTTFPSDSRKLIYFLHLFLTYSLTHIASRWGGKPYGIGIWNLPQLKKFYSDEALKEHKHFKREFDPLNLLNPAKSLSYDHKVSGFLKLAYLMSDIFSNGNPLVKPFKKILNRNYGMNKKTLSESDACANCGACVPVCPAYLMNKTELVTAKGKLFLLKHLIDGTSVPKHVAQKAFMCLHCHLCEYVCQSKLELMSVWDRLESLLEKKYGRPKEKIDEFVKQVESHPFYTQLVDSVSFSSNNNHREPENV
ncbi:MAG: FAD-binding protein [Candidatus Aminicenantes bacterium]|nr:MAG: FAD-binding protein [Candidatus Aminicenantes bacterium]